MGRIVILFHVLYSLYFPCVLNAEFIPHAALNRGVPENLLGSTDYAGYVLHSVKLFDIPLPCGYTKCENPVIPFRLLFYTNHSNRKSVLFDTYWNISIFDSLIIKKDKKLYIWQTPDLNIIKFYYQPLKKCWVTSNIEFELIEISKNEVQIKSYSPKSSITFTYKNSLLQGIRIRHNNKQVFNFRILRNKHSLSVLDEVGSAICTIKLEMNQKLKCNTLKITTKTDTVNCLISKECMYFNNDLTYLNLISKILYKEKIYKYLYRSNKEYTELYYRIEPNAKRNVIKWRSTTGFIVSENDTKYEVVNTNTSTSISKITDLNSNKIDIKYTIKKQIGTEILETNLYKIDKAFIKGVPTLAGKPRIVEYTDKSNRKLRKTRFLFDTNGNALKTITTTKDIK